METPHDYGTVFVFPSFCPATDRRPCGHCRHPSDDKDARAHTGAYTWGPAAIPQKLGSSPAKPGISMTKNGWKQPNMDEWHAKDGYLECKWIGLRRLKWNHVVLIDDIYPVKFPKTIQYCDEGQTYLHTPKIHTSTYVPGEYRVMEVSFQQRQLGHHRHSGHVFSLSPILASATCRNCLCILHYIYTI